MDAKDIILPVAAIATISTGSAATTQASNQYDSSLNHASTWGTSCVKKDMTGEVMTYTPSISSDKIEKVIVKGGTENAVYTTAPFTNLTAPINPKNGKPYAISHVIVCTKDGTAVQANVEAGQGSVIATPAATTTNKPVSATPTSATDITETAVLADETVQPTASGTGAATELPETGIGMSVAGAISAGVGALTYVGARAVASKTRKQS